MYTKAKEKIKVPEAECAFTQLREQYRMVRQDKTCIPVQQEVHCVCFLSLRLRPYANHLLSCFTTKL